VTICRYLVWSSVFNISCCNRGVIADKWLTLPNMGHIVATCYNRVAVQLVLPERGICETYFPIRGAPPLNPHSNIMCLCLILGHLLHVYLKDGFPLPSSCGEWKNHKIGVAEQWEFAFMDRQALFKDMMSKELKPPLKSTNQLNPLYCETPTPEKQKEEFEVIEEHEDGDENDAMSVAS